MIDKNLLSKSSLWKSLLKKKLWEEKERDFGEKTDSVNKLTK